VLVDLHIVPNAKKSEIVGTHGDALKVRVAAPPVDGAANDEICRFIAKLVGVPRSAVTIVRGQTSKAKTVSVAGASLQKVQAVLITP
jgi:uncharacterized protein (TIGR00251 family)